MGEEGTVGQRRAARRTARNQTHLAPTASQSRGQGIGSHTNDHVILARLNPAQQKIHKIRVPNPEPTKLLNDERSLLSKTLTLNPNDVLYNADVQTFASTQSTSFRDADQLYAQQNSHSGFKRADKLADVGPPTSDPLAFKYEREDNGPVGSTQASMAIMSFLFFAAQGIVAGGSVMQILVMPSHFGANDLSLHLSYASITVHWQSVMSLSAGLAFLGACDVMCFSPAFARTRATVVMLLYGSVSLLLALEIPLDVSLVLGFDDRSAALATALQNAGDDPARFIYPRYNVSSIDVPLALENNNTSDLIGMQLSAGSLGLWWWLSLLRACCAFAAWILSSTGMSSPQIALPGVDQTSPANVEITAPRAAMRATHPFS